MTQFNEVGPATESEKPKKCSCKCKAIVAAILIVFIIAGVVCWHVHRPKPITPDLKPGTQCVIHFRQDAFSTRPGITSLPVIPSDIASPMTVSFRGTVVAVVHEAILFEAVYENITYNGVSKTERFWIPKNNILLIQFTDHADI